MIDRRVAALAAGAGLLILTAASGDLDKLPRRAAFLFRTASADSNTRHLNGTVASPDRQFYVFLESARRNLPPATPGVAVLGAPLDSPAEYLVPYHFTPVRATVLRDRIPPGWLLAVYGQPPPGAWKVVAQVWKGVLMAPGP
ncbi:MAG TPA: hypothetical protein VKG01_02340 [Thermoanaerobaculia bacterium]|nr:hypothetical protein [Thermoanaerobaculia bacterium]